MEEKMEIGGVEYTFTCNRKTLVALEKIKGDLGKIQDGGEIPVDMIDKMAYAYLKPAHPNITIEEVGKLLDTMEEEFGTAQTMEFLTTFAQDCFTVSDKEEEAKKKIIPYLVRKKMSK